MSNKRKGGWKESVAKKAKPPKQYKDGDSVAMHMKNGNDEEVVYYGQIKGQRKKGEVIIKGVKEEFYFYRASYFDVLDDKNPDYEGCYKLLKSYVDIDEDDILGEVVWVKGSLTCSNKTKCKYHLGSEQYDKFDKMVEVRWQARGNQDS